MSITEPIAAPPGIAAAGTPADAVLQRLNDPVVAASVINLLDNAQLLSILVTGLSELIQRGDTIVDSVRDGIGELHHASNQPNSVKFPTMLELAGLARQLNDTVPTLRLVLESSMVRPETIGLLGMVSDAVIDGKNRAQAGDVKVGGVGGLLKMLKDKDIQRGLGFVQEIAKALGSRLASSQTSTSTGASPERKA